MSAVIEELFTLWRRLFGWNEKLGVTAKFSLILGAALLFVVTWAVVIEVFARQVFNISLHWIVEYTEYIVPIIAVWGAAYVLRENRHVNADVILHLLPDKTKQWLLLIGFILALGFLSILSKDFLALSLRNIEMDFRSFYPSETPYGYLQLFMFIGLALFTLQLIAEIIRKARRLFLSYKKSIIVK